MFTLLKAKKNLIIAGFIAVALFAGWYYYKDTQATLHRQGAEIAAKTLAITSQKGVIDQQIKDIKKQQKITRTMDQKFQSSRTQVDDLQAKFVKLGNSSRVTSDIGKLAIARPKLIERIINSGTTDALRCVEIISGAKLTDKEKSAEKKSEINNACPSIANPAYIKH